MQLASAIMSSDAAKTAEAAKEKAGAGAATTPAPAVETAAAAAPTPAPSLVNLELTPEMTSDNPLETRDLAFYTQTIGEGNPPLLHQRCLHVCRSNFLLVALFSIYHEVALQWVHSNIPFGLICDWYQIEFNMM